MVDYTINFMFQPAPLLSNGWDGDLGFRFQTASTNWGQPTRLIQIYIIYDNIFNQGMQIYLSTRKI